jgi:hypothetical protein
MSTVNVTSINEERQCEYESCILGMWLEMVVAYFRNYLKLLPEELQRNQNQDRRSIGRVLKRGPLKSETGI